MLHLREILLSLIIIIPSIAAHAADGRTMTDKLTCYNYEERIVFILDLKKDNEKLNRMSLAVVKRTEDSIELTSSHPGSQLEKQTNCDQETLITTLESSTDIKRTHLFSNSPP